MPAQLPNTWKLLTSNKSVSLDDLSRAVLTDLVPPDRLGNLNLVLKKLLPDTARSWAFDAVSHLVWADETNLKLSGVTVRKQGLQHPLGLPFPLGVLLIETLDEQPSLQQATLEKLHRAWCNAQGDDPALRASMREDGLLVVVVQGKKDHTPDLYAAAMRSTEAERSAEAEPSLGVLRVLLDRAMHDDTRPREIALKRALEPLAKLADSTRVAAADPTRVDAWRGAFGRFDASASYDRFRGALRGALEETMRLIERTTKRVAHDDESLGHLREAASILAFRVFFITALEQRKLLYAAGFTPKHYFTGLVADPAPAPERSGFLRLQALTARIRGTKSPTGRSFRLDLAVQGASIFANRPNEHFAPAMEQWLDALDAHTASLNEEDALRTDWDAVMARLSLLATGQITRYEDATEAQDSDVSVGGIAHVQRVLGDVYEQILAMTPVVEGTGRQRVLKLVPPTSESAKKKAAEAKATGGNDAARAKAERKALGAHYTPESLVLEVVRAALQPAFAAAWSRAQGRVASYREALLDLRVLDPAMGSAHFLTVTALEIAREIAWSEHFRAPRPAEHFEVIANPTPWATLAPEVAAALNERAARELQTVVERCCFGVDLAPLAVELGKLALWQLTMVERSARGVQDDAPPPSLTFLDNNLRCGDSLLGSTWADVEKLCDTFQLEGVDGDLFGRLSASPRGALRLLQVLEPQLSGIPSALRATVEKERASIVQELGPLPASLPADDHALRKLVFSLIHQGKERYRWLWDLAFLYAWHQAGSGRDVEAALKAALNLRASGSWPALVGLGEPTPAQQKARDAIRQQAHALRAFHWELEFYDVFHRKAGGFDVIVANPPFLGDRDLRAARTEQGVNYLRARYTGKATPDLCGFFVLNFNKLLSPSRGVAGTVAPNTLAQGKNRTSALVPLVTGSPAPFEIYRSCQSREWPGEAAVHIATVHLRRTGNPALVAETRRIVQVQRDTDDDLDDDEEEDGKKKKKRTKPAADPGSVVLSVVSLSGVVDCSFLDGGVETELFPIDDQKTLAYTGMFPRGEFDRPLDFIQQVPKPERHAVYAYLNNRDVQQQPEPVPQRVIIDVYDALVLAGLTEATAPKQEAWLKANLPFLYAELKRTVYPERQKLPAGKDNEPAREFWWHFQKPRPTLRAARQYISNTVTFGAVGKVLKPVLLDTLDPSLRCRITPTHQLLLVPSESRAFLAVTSTLLFETITRRSCSSLKSDLRFTPSEVFPYFPFPWKGQPTGNPNIAPALNPPPAVEKRLGPVAEQLLALRKGLLTQPTRHGLSAGEFRGPTALYNAFDNPDDTRPAIEQLRAAHRALEAAVLAEYGWSDLADASRWTFDRPWIDGTTRYVPNQATRRAYLERLAALNHTRTRG